MIRRDLHAAGRLSTAAMKVWRQASPFGEVTVGRLRSGRSRDQPARRRSTRRRGRDPDPRGRAPARRLVRGEAARVRARPRSRRHRGISPDGAGDAWRAKSAWGETVTYGELADLAGRPRARRRGCAMRDNPLPFVIPCHRVVAAGGRIGGYGGGRNAVALEAPTARPRRRHQTSLVERGVSAARRASRLRGRSRCPCRRRR